MWCDFVGLNNAPLGRCTPGTQQNRGPKDEMLLCIAPEILDAGSGWGLETYTKGW